MSCWTCCGRLPTQCIEQSTLRRRPIACPFQNSRSCQLVYFTSSSHRRLVFARLNVQDHAENSRVPHHHTAVVRLHASSTNPLAASKCKRGRHKVRLPKKSAKHKYILMHDIPVCRRLQSQLPTSRPEPSSPSVIAVHTRPRQLTSFNMQGIQGSVAEDPAHICMHAGLARPICKSFRADVSSVESSWTSL